MRYIQRFDSASTEQAAIDAGQLGKPYIAFIEDGQYLDWNTKTPATSGLPSNTFLFNYNAKEYDASTGTLPKTSGQTMNSNLDVRGGDYISFLYPDSFSVQRSIAEQVVYTHYTLNPLNRNSADTTFTFIYKTRDFYGEGANNLLAVRRVGDMGGNEDGVYDAYNWMIRSDYFHAKEQILAFDPLNNPQIIAIRVNSDGSGERIELDVQGNVVQSASTQHVEWGKQASGFYWFGSYFYEWFRNTFYWMYCSTEALTDQEIRKVIDYNENL